MVLQITFVGEGAIDQGENFLDFLWNKPTLTLEEMTSSQNF